MATVAAMRNLAGRRFSATSRYHASAPRIAGSSQTLSFAKSRMNRLFLLYLFPSGLDVHVGHLSIVRIFDEVSLSYSEARTGAKARLLAHGSPLATTEILNRAPLESAPAGTPQKTHRPREHRPMNMGSLPVLAGLLPWRRPIEYNWV